MVLGTVFGLCLCVTSTDIPFGSMPCRRQWLDSAHGHQDGAAVLAEAAAEEAAAAAAMGVRRVGAVEDLRCLDEDLDREASAAASRYLQI